jgi:hypothetical protein
VLSTFGKVGLQKCPFERFLLATVLVVAEATAVAGVAKVDLATPPCCWNLVFQRLRAIMRAG